MYDLTPRQWDTSTDDAVLDKILNTIRLRKNELEASHPILQPHGTQALSSARQEYLRAKEKWERLGQYTKLICGTEAFYNMNKACTAMGPLSDLLYTGRHYGEIKIYGDPITFEIRRLPEDYDRIVTLL